MPRFAKGSPEARAWGEEMKAKRNAKRAAAGKPAVKADKSTNADILRSADKAFAARKKREAASKAADKAAAEEEETIKAEVAAEKKAKAPRKPRAKKAAIEKVKEEVVERVKEEGVEAEKPSTEEVNTVEKLSIKELRSRVKAARKIACPPIGKMKHNRVIVEIIRLTGAGGHAAVEKIYTLKNRQAKDYLRELRKIHCPFVSKMKREALVKEVLAAEEIAESLKASKMSSEEDIAKTEEEVKFNRELTAADKKIETKKRSAEMAKFKRAGDKFAKLDKDADLTEDEKKALAVLESRERKMGKEYEKMRKQALEMGRDSPKDLPQYKEYTKRRRQLNSDYKKFFGPISLRELQAAKPKKAEKVKADPDAVRAKRLAALEKAREARKAKKEEKNAKATGAEEAKKEALKAAMKKREEEEAAKKAEEEAAAKKKAQAATERKKVFQGKAVKGRKRPGQ